MLVLSIEVGLHVPLMPLVEVVGNEGIVSPTQKGPIWLKVGGWVGIITTVMSVAVAQSPASGVKV